MPTPAQVLNRTRITAAPERTHLATVVAGGKVRLDVGAAEVAVKTFGAAPKLGARVLVLLTAHGSYLLAGAAGGTTPPGGPATVHASAQLAQPAYTQGEHEFTAAQWKPVDLTASAAALRTTIGGNLQSTVYGAGLALWYELVVNGRPLGLARDSGLYLAQGHLAASRTRIVTLTKGDTIKVLPKWWLGQAPVTDHTHITQGLLTVEPVEIV